MVFSELLDVSKFASPDDYVRAALFPEPGKRRPGKLMKIRRLAVSCGIHDVMKKDRDSLILELVQVIGWKGVYDGAISDIGVIRSDFLKLGLSREEFYDLLQCGRVRETGRYRYTWGGKSTYSPVYDVYDYFKIMQNVPRIYC